MDSELPLPSMNEESDSPASEFVPPSPQPWGFWATMGLGAVIGIAYIVAQTIGAFAWILIAGLPMGRGVSSIQELTENGGVIAYATLWSAIVTVTFCVAVARLRKGITIREYFALRWPAWRAARLWAIGFVIYLAGCGYALSFMDTSATEEFATKIQQVTGGAKILLWIALYLGAPITEEIYFRGFLFAGIRASRLGPIGAIVITTLLFTAIHVQYQLQGLLFVAAASVFLGTVRHKTNSLPLCMALHSMMNLIATVGR